MKLKVSKTNRLVIALITVAVLEILSILGVTVPLWVELPVFLIIVAVFGRGILLSGARSLLRLNFSDINLLMDIAIAGAIYLGQYAEASVIIVLFALGETLEEYGIERSQTALKNLVEKSPKSAEVKDKEGKVPVEQIKIGDVVIVRPGNEIPIDGVVENGDSLVDEAAITGEPIPRNKHLGDNVYAGTLNKQGYLEIAVKKESKDSTLSKIINLTYESYEKKAGSQRFIEKFARYYTPVVFLTAVLLIIVPVFFFNEPFRPWFTQSLTLLLISCPCALVISTPVAVFSAIGVANRKGAIIKGGKYIEEMGRVKVVALDKTRTLTKGELIVSDIVPFNNYTEADVIACAAGMEAFSEHPIAKSIIAKAESMNLKPHEFTNFTSEPGKGLRGVCKECCDTKTCLGNIRFVSEEHQIGEDVQKKVTELESLGKTAIVTCDGVNIKGVIALTDEIRKESRPLIAELRRMGITPVMLTGDNKASAEFVAKELGITDIKAGLLPDEKVREVSRLVTEYKHVAMVGDGVNDAPALANASVGIAMGAIGSDIAIENADIALMTDNIALISYLAGLGRACLGKIRFNIAFAVIAKLVFLVLAITGRSSLVLAIFADVGVTVLVILNSLELYRYDRKLAG